jgi:multiple sugar transport system ATP-binding protein
MTLQLKNIQKVYSSGSRAVNGIDLDIQDGEFFTLLGPSGCGKTTTLRMIAGLETPSAGSIFIRGRDFTNTHPRDRDVAMVFQSYALYPHMSVRKNLTLNLQVRRVPDAEIAERLKSVAQMLGIQALLDRKPAELSGGQRQRVALGRALIRRPNVFLMDEPLSNLDLKLRERTRTELKKLHEELRVTTVYVTHDQAEALVLSDRIGIMDAGDLVQVGAPQDIYDRPRSVFVAKFVGTPSINLLAVTAEVRDDSLTIRLASNGMVLRGASLRASAPVVEALRKVGNVAVLGVRPEAIALLREPSGEAIPTAVDFVEPMGSVNNVVLNSDEGALATVDGEPLIAVVTSNESFASRAKTWLALRPERLVIFDTKSGKTLATLSPSRFWQPCDAELSRRTEFGDPDAARGAGNAFAPSGIPVSDSL